MRKNGYQLENVSLHYNGNQGLDLIFRSSSGPPVIYAVLEAKNGSSMGTVKTSEGGLRQGSHEYNMDRISKYLESPDAAHREMGMILEREAIAGQLRSFISFRGSERIIEIPLD